MIRWLNNLIRRLVTRSNKKACKHTDTFTGDNWIIISDKTILGSWQRVPHPHPRFATLKIDRREFQALSTCTKCGEAKLVSGFDYRDIVS